MTDFTLYDVVNHCRVCGFEYPAKAFLPQGTEPRFGLCPECKTKDDAHMAQLTQPPKPLFGKEPKVTEMRTETRRRGERRQTRWEPD